MALWLLELEVSNKNCDLVQSLLFDEAGYGWEETEPTAGKTMFRVYYEEREFLEKIADAAKSLEPEAAISISEVENKDWQFAWREYFTPVEAGSRFVILPPWLAHLEHSKREEIIIEPKNAFGTGHHASTVLCLQALSELLDRKKLNKRDWFLDLGCGSGILAIAAAKAGMSGTALDIDPAAIANSRENRELNSIEDLEILLGGIEKVGGAKYDLVMANILAEPLIDLAPKIMGCLKKRACLILGGVLANQAEAVVSAYATYGMENPHNLRLGEWIALLWERGYE